MSKKHDFSCFFALFIKNQYKQGIFYYGDFSKVWDSWCYKYAREKLKDDDFWWKIAKNHDFLRFFHQKIITSSFWLAYLCIYVLKRSQNSEIIKDWTVSVVIMTKNAKKHEFSCFFSILSWLLPKQSRLWYFTFWEIFKKPLNRICLTNTRFWWKMSKKHDFSCFLTYFHQKTSVSKACSIQVVSIKTMISDVMNMPGRS